jgi:hypothetical protein
VLWPPILPFQIPGFAGSFRPVFIDGSFAEWDPIVVRGAGSLESAGIEFIDENGGGPGVRLRKSPKQKR